MSASFMPGPWKVGYDAHDVVAPSKRGGEAKVCDIRGWGYLTGKGHGALGLSAEEGRAVQEANASLIAAAPEMLAALKTVNKLISEAAMTGFNYADGDWAQKLFHSQQATSRAIAKAEGRP